MGLLPIVQLGNGTATRQLSTWTGTVPGPVNSNMVVVGVVQYGNANNWGNATYGGVSMTKIAHINYNSFGEMVNGIVLYYLIGNKTGNQTLTVPAKSGQWVYPRWVFYKNVASFEGHVTTTGYTSTNELTISGTTIGDNASLVGYIGTATAVTITAVNGCVSRGIAGAAMVADRLGPLTPPGSYTMDWSLSGNSFRTGIWAAFLPRIRTRRQVLYSG